MTTKNGKLFGGRDCDLSTKAKTAPACLVLAVEAGNGWTSSASSWGTRHPSTVQNTSDVSQRENQRSWGRDHATKPSVFTGVAVMLFTAVLGVALKWDWYVSVGTGTAVFAVTWIWLLRYYLDLLVDEEHIKPESVTPAIPAHTTRLAVTLDENRHQEVTLPLQLPHC